MTRFFCLFIIGAFSLQSAYSCGSAYQFKIFPVGMIKDTIVTIDIQIWRSDNLAFIQSMEEGNVSESAENISMFSWRLKSRLTKYDKYQQVLQTTLLDSLQINTNDYTGCLRQLYQKNLIDALLLHHKQIQLFEPEYISFCEFNTICDLVTSKEKTLIYSGKQYPLKVFDFSNRAYFGFNNLYFLGLGDEYFETEEDKVMYEEMFMEMPISSVRRYKAGKKELIVAHLARGHELSMGMITHDSNDPRLKDDYTNENEAIPMLMKEYTPDIPFNFLYNAAYEEPLLHHGYGFDVFIVK